ncbi:MAG: bifunctional hydroxymethylpyrimidine kinase/phosphomethylpyrimidine kinase [Chthoniobacterales bacterium]|nr:bifunctional hydroxymethylpyrimidine kinase/phosphomethylpyrimidine kinase [Chthoniobacterales bacterium]
MIPVALTIAGSDCSAGAGLQADLKTFSALGVYCLTAVTCVVAEVPGKVSRIQAVAAENVRTQIELLLASFPVAAVKTGLLYSPEVVEIVADIFEKSALRNIPLIIDPVMIATSGDVLLQSAAVEIYRSRLFRLATLVTPNMAEAAALTGRPVRDIDEMRTAGEQLQAEFGARFLVKGGHLSGDRAIDLLFDGSRIEEFSAPFHEGISTHGTGCTYSAAIAAGLAQGHVLETAIARAKEFVSRAIGEHFSWTNSLGKIDALNHVIQASSLSGRPGFQPGASPSGGQDARST